MISAEQPWTNVRDALARGTAVAILPCGATEAHGPHLPLNTDVIISEGMAHRAAAELHGQGLFAFILPSIAYSPAGYASEFAGTISIDADTFKRLLLGIARNLKAQGFACLAIANSHFDPANVSALREITDEIRKTGLKVAFPDFTRRALAQKLTAEFVSGACHAGRFETSIVLAERPELVNETVQNALAENPSSLIAAFARGARTFTEAGGPDAYFGDPASATVEEGQATLSIMSQCLTEAIREALTTS